jgi:hypothetical protein
VDLDLTSELIRTIRLEVQQWRQSHDKLSK